MALFLRTTYQTASGSFREPPPPTLTYSFAKSITYVACKLAESLIQL